MIYLIILISLFVIELLYFRIAHRLNIIDKPNNRSSHTRITLRGGGIIFWVGIFLYFLVSSFNYPWFFVGLTLIAAISFADDISSQPPKIRLLIQFVALFMMFYQWQLFELTWYFVVIALVLGAGIFNAFNFMDGINGITGAYSMTVVGSLWYINNFVEYYVDNQLVYIILLSLLVFNFFNFRTKAKCFAGDVGSISIAFSIVFLLGMLIIQTNNFSYIVLLLVYGIDTVLTIIHRVILKENITKPHRMHLYQLFSNELKIPHLLVSSIYALVQFVVFVGFLLVENSILYLVVTSMVLSGVYLSFKIRYFHLHKK